MDERSPQPWTIGNEGIPDGHMRTAAFKFARVLRPVGAWSRHPGGTTLAAMKRITLTTTGRRTGEHRAVTLYAFDDDDRLVVVGSRGGSARDPAWAINLRADPHASVGRGRNAQQMVVHEAEGDERDRLWQLVSSEFPMYERYQRRTSRRIPLFVLQPPTPD